MKRYHTSTAPRRLFKSTWAIGAAIIVLCTSAVAVYNANFTGEWKLNEEKSELGQFGARMAARTVRVTSSDEQVSVERVSVNQNGDQVERKETLTFDGKETESTGGFGNSKRKATAKWSDDGKSMIIDAVLTFDRNGETMEIKQKETWTLSEDGQTLTVLSHSSSSFGDNDMKLVYNKVR